MHHVVQLHFDADTEEKLRKAKAALVDLDLATEITSISRPHMTLATAQPVGDVEAAAHELKEAFREFSTQSVHLTYLGLFPLDGDHHILYAGISPAQELCRLQEKVYRIIERHSPEASALTRPGMMVFHSTLALKVSSKNLPKAMALLKTLVPMTGRFINAGFIEYPSAAEKASFNLVQPKKIPSLSKNTCPSPRK